MYKKYIWRGVGAMVLGYGAFVLNSVQFDLIGCWIIGFLFGVWYGRDLPKNR